MSLFAVYDEKSEPCRKYARRVALIAALTVSIEDSQRPRVVPVFAERVATQRTDLLLCYYHFSTSFASDWLRSISGEAPAVDRT